MFDACFRKAQSPMGALAPCAPPVCDYDNHVSVLSRTHLSCHCVCVCACVYSYVPREALTLSWGQSIGTPQHLKLSCCLPTKRQVPTPALHASLGAVLASSRPRRGNQPSCLTPAPPVPLPTPPLLAAPPPATALCAPPASLDPWADLARPAPREPSSLHRDLLPPARLAPSSGSGRRRGACRPTTAW